MFPMRIKRLLLHRLEVFLVFSAKNEYRYEEIYQRNNRRLANYAAAQVHNREDAEELANEAMLVLWRKMQDAGVDTTLLLCQRINHPSPAMHRVFAELLYHCILGERAEEGKVSALDGMYKE